MLSDLLDADYYRRLSGCDQGVGGLVQHFVAYGDAAGLDPSPYFATVWYKARYPNWARHGARTAFEDFLFQVQRNVKRQPHPLIDPDDYRAAYPDLEGLGAAVVLHFMRHGDGEGRSPSAGFDAGFYRRCYLPLGAAFPFRHYMTEGKSLDYLPRPVTRSRPDSTAAMSKMIAGCEQPILLASHDAQRAGVPILTLDLARALQHRGWTPVFLLGNAGPLLPRFRALGPVFILAEGWDVAGLGSALPRGTPALINTAAIARVGAPLAEAGLNCLVLMHEMAAYIRDQGLLSDLGTARAAGARLIASMPRTVQALADVLPGLEHVMPGIVLPDTPLAAFRQRLRNRRASPVFIGAGHADRRKGFDLFLEAAAAITRQAPQARFVWLGELDDWAQTLANKALAEGLDLELPGFVDDSLARYRAADVYLLTSRQDPGPTTVIHAAAVGTPFVGYAADIGINGMTEGLGQFVPPEEPGTFVDTALRLAAGVTPAFRRRLRREIRARTGFAPYVDALLSRLSRAQDGAA
ncbi:hypothetical protein B6K69_17825 (plasmid) [Fuscovulum blasticum]|nr:hypothetical protein B6K69_17825 [Fuscovulum blasticum]